MNVFIDIAQKEEIYELELLTDSSNYINIKKKFIDNINYSDIDLLCRFDCEFMLNSEKIFLDKDNKINIVTSIPSIQLSTLLYEPSKFLISDKLKLLYELCRTLIFLHDNNIIYNDLTISNIFLSKNKLSLINFDNSYYSEDNHDKNKEFINFIKLSLLLNIDLSFAKSLKELSAHEIFKDYRCFIDNNIITPSCSLDINNDNREKIKILYNIYEKSLNNSYVIVLFLAIDLYYRCSSFCKYSQDIERNKLVLACLSLACKILPQYAKINTPLLISFNSTFGSLNETDLDILEKKVVIWCNGVLNSNILYNICKNKKQLHETFIKILFSKNIYLYYNVDYVKWEEILDERYNYVESKLITYTEMLN